MNLEEYENAQEAAAIAYGAYKEIYEKRKASMLDAFVSLKRLSNIDAETAFFSFGQYDAAMAITKVVEANSMAEFKEDVGSLAAPFVWTAFRMLDELRKEGKIAEDA